MVESTPTLIAVVALEEKIRKILKKLRRKTSEQKPMKPERLLDNYEIKVFHNYKKLLKKRGLREATDGRCWVE